MYTFKNQEPKQQCFPQLRNRQKMRLCHRYHHYRQAGKKDHFQVKLVLTGFRRDKTGECTKSPKDKMGKLRECSHLLCSMGRLGCWITSNQVSLLHWLHY